MQFLRADLWRWPIDVSIACLAFSAVKWWSHDDPVFEGGSADTNGTCPECAYWPSTGCCSGKGRVGSNCKNRQIRQFSRSFSEHWRFTAVHFHHISTISIFRNFLSRGSVLETARSFRIGRFRSGLRLQDEGGRLTSDVSTIPTVWSTGNFGVRQVRLQHRPAKESQRQVVPWRAGSWWMADDKSIQKPKCIQMYDMNIKYRSWFMIDISDFVTRKSLMFVVSI